MQWLFVNDVSSCVCTIRVGAIQSFFMIPTVTWVLVKVSCKWWIKNHENWVKVSRVTSTVYTQCSWEGNVAQRAFAHPTNHVKQSLHLFQPISLNEKDKTHTHTTLKIVEYSIAEQGGQLISVLYTWGIRISSKKIDGHLFTLFKDTAWFISRYWILHNVTTFQNCIVVNFCKFATCNINENDILKTRCRRMLNLITLQKLFIHAYKIQEEMLRS